MKPKHGPSLPDVRLRSRSSHTWHVIVDIWEVVLKNLSWVIRDGKGTRFWKDSWIPNMGALCDDPSVRVPPFEAGFSVSHYAGWDSWDWP